MSLCNLFLASPLVFSLSPSLSTRAVYHSRVNETTKLTRSFHIVVYTVDRIRSKSNPEICSRSVVGDFSSSQPFLLFYPPFLRVYIYIYTHRFTISLIRSSWCERRYHGDKKRGIRNRSSHLSQTRPRHDISRISWDNRFISTPRIPFGNGTTETSRSRNVGKIVENVDIDSISILFSLFFSSSSLYFFGYRKYC